MHLGGDGKKILIDPLISGLRRGDGAREPRRTREKSVAQSNKDEQERDGKDSRWTVGVGDKGRAKRR